MAIVRTWRNRWPLDDNAKTRACDLLFKWGFSIVDEVFVSPSTGNIHGCVNAEGVEHFDIYDMGTRYRGRWHPDYTEEEVKRALKEKKPVDICVFKK